MKSAGLVALAASLPFALAQSPAWGQCGGIGWSGPTSCASGSTCTKVDDYYSQCIPGSNPGNPESTSTTPSSTVAPPTNTQPPVADNPYTGYTIYLSPYYADEIDAAAANITDSTLKAKALKVKEIPTFIWFDTTAKLSTLEPYLKDASAKGKAEGKKYLLQIVVYNLPERDCAALASNGELTIDNGGEAKYRQYIDAMVATIKKYPDVRVVAVIEPDSLANLVTNLNVQKCSRAQTVYKTSTQYALKQLDTAGVYMYLDAGHAGWLGWPANLTPAAQLFQQVWQDAGSPKSVRGLSTNVANFNALRAASPDPVTSPNPNYDEIHYIESLAGVLSPFPAHFIVDQGRAGQQNLRKEWSDWCNVKGAGFGTRPTINTGSSLIDSIVWVKPGGESDGTSDSSAARFDAGCVSASSHVPAPEAGTWFQEYFEALVRNANPAL
ncbi:cellobiohydrolase ii [Moniliophthora roreri MCA 2997]|uniref:Glucanase n=1 Tax=Moniliophthora roreri (strain MCA 2997) TaxID=1381753 RepID=V2X4U0_MONRO|nr:cellobiohydrolase ii [Moniliophthora roreri MCA 2997]